MILLSLHLSPLHSLRVERRLGEDAKRARCRQSQTGGFEPESRPVVFPIRQARKIPACSRDHGRAPGGLGDNRGVRNESVVIDLAVSVLIFCVFSLVEDLTEQSEMKLRSKETELRLQSKEKKSLVLKLTGSYMKHRAILVLSTLVSFLSRRKCCNSEARRREYSTL